MRIVADTNLIISSIFWSGAPYKIIRYALQKKLEIITSQEILNEVRKVLTDPQDRFELSEQELDDVINGIVLYANIINPTINIDIVRDPKDNHGVACAIAAKAEYIVTRDKDLLVLKTHAGIKIITPDDFLTLFKSED